MKKLNEKASGELISTNQETLFKESPFNGDISNWDVSHVEDMFCMFSNSQFNGDTSHWDISRVEDMSPKKCLSKDRF